MALALGVLGTLAVMLVPLPPVLLDVLLTGNLEVTDDTVAILKDCVNLTHVQLTSTKVTDAGLAHFKDNTACTELDLHNTLIGDDGLKLVAKWPNLTRLNVSDTRVTAAGVAEVRKALPRCQLTWQGGVTEPKK